MNIQEIREGEESQEDRSHWVKEDAYEFKVTIPLLLFSNPYFSTSQENTLKTSHKRNLMKC